MPIADLPLPGRLEVFRQRLVAIPERMGETLARTAYSANIKERRDHSCALFDAAGNLLAQAAHIPVHLGSMAVSVAAARDAVDMRPGDAVLLNDPYAGGTHLPDLTLVSPIHDDKGGLLGYVANRAHHSDVGGATPGSMGASESIHEEGLRIPPVRWFEAGREVFEVRRLLLANVRTPEERLGDLRAQAAANEVGRTALCALMARYEPAEFARLAEALCDYAERRMRAAISRIADGTYRHTDHLEGDGFSDDLIPITVTLTVRGDEVEVDFAGTSSAVRGCVNCPLTVARAAVNYAFTCLAGRGVPLNAGLDRPIRITAPAGCLVNARYPSAVAAGNVETSQRIVDVLLGALAEAVPELIPAASAGTMTSLTLGGQDPRNGGAFTYYETVGGGSGGAVHGDGESGIHTHMTNTRNTPIEALEAAVPVRVCRYALADRLMNRGGAARRDSAAQSAGIGGAGVHRGGHGIVRELLALADMQGALLNERARLGPAGRAGGCVGGVGRAELVHGDGRVTLLAAKGSFELSRGDVLRLITPGGGGYGSAH